MPGVKIADTFALTLVPFFIKMAVLFISHNLYAVRQLCERVLIMKDAVMNVRKR